MNNTTTTTAGRPAKHVDVRRLVFTALLGALSIVLANFLKFKVPIMPGFISFDFSDMPAMLASLTMGPVSGVLVALIKNLQGLMVTETGGVGELSNFILSASLVLPAGIVAMKTKKLWAIIVGCVGGAVLMGLVSIASNYFIMYPAYAAVFIPKPELSMSDKLDIIVGMYKGLIPALDGSINGLLDVLVMFNMPFTMVKGLTAAIISVPLYKRLRPVFNSFYRNEG